MNHKGKIKLHILFILTGLLLSFAALLARPVATAVSSNRNGQPASQPSMQLLQTCPVDLLLVLDGSSSIAVPDFEMMKNFLRQLVATLTISPADANLGIVQFSSSTVLHIGLSDNPGILNQVIDEMTQLNEGTDIVSGLQLAQDRLELGRPDIPHVIILLTDGEHTEAGNPIATANSLRAANVQIIGIAVGQANLDQISTIAGGDNNVFLITGFEGLSVILDLLINSVCAAATPPGETQIVFASDRDGDLEIYVMDADGSNLRQLTFNNVIDDKPSWSKDGRKIAFESNLDGDFEIVVIDADGSNLRQLTFNSVDDWGPAWSPDGIRLAFHSALDGDVEIYVMDETGANLQQITFNNGPIDRSPTWSPGGDSLIYYSDLSGGRELYLVNLHTSATVRLTNNAYYDGLPDWSLNGMQVVFGSARENDDVEIFAMRVDGSNVRRLTNRPGIDDDPVWSPDGKQVVYESDAGGDLEIWIMNADGSNARPLTDNQFLDWSADWIWKPQ
jgi:Tol biopolymer transport system component